MSKPGVGGIYKITCLGNNKIYIGSAINFNTRKNNHFSMLHRGIHDSKYMQRSYQKYGKDSFVFEIVEYVEDFNTLLEREQYYLDTFQPWNPEIGFNSSKTAGSMFGYKHSEESRKKMSEKKIGVFVGRPISEEHKKRLSELKKGKPLSEATKKAQLEATTRTYKFISPDGVAYEGKNVKKFCRDMNLDYSSICSLRKGKFGQYEGWTCPNNGFEYKRIKPFKVVAPDGTVHEGLNVSGFAVKHGLHKSALHRVVDGIQKSTMGWKLAN